MQAMSSRISHYVIGIGQIRTYHIRFVSAEWQTIRTNMTNFVVDLGHSFIHVYGIVALHS